MEDFGLTAPSTEETYPHHPDRRFDLSAGTAVRQARLEVYLDKRRHASTTRPPGQRPAMKIFGQNFRV